jgi:hypothetical protein
VVAERRPVCVASRRSPSVAAHDVVRQPVEQSPLFTRYDEWRPAARPSAAGQKRSSAQHPIRVRLANWQQLRLIAPPGMLRQSLVRRLGRHRLDQLAAMRRNTWLPSPEFATSIMTYVR